MMIKYLLEKEFKQMLRDPMTLFIVLIVPILFIAILPQVTTYEVKKIPCCIVDQDHSQASSRLIQKICSSNHFSLIAVDDTYDRSVERVDRGEANLILQIPQGMEKDITTGASIDFMIGANAINGNQGQISVAYMSSILHSYVAEANDSRNVNIESVDVEPQVHGVFNEYMDYKNYMIPGLLCNLLMLVCSLPSLNIAMEKENGTVTQIKVSPAGISRYLLSKMIPYWAMALVALAFAMFWSWVFYGIWPHAPFIIMLYSLVFVIAASGIQLILSGSSQNIQQTMIASVFVFMIISLFNGLYAPIQNMPEWGQYLTNLNPQCFIIKIFRAIYQKDCNFTDLIQPFGMLVLLTVLYNGIGYFLYARKQ